VNENILQEIWAGLRFDTRNLILTDGSRLHILDPGFHNSDQGPDFLGARLRINGTLWIGDVEIHLRSAEWYRHRHHTDENYNGVILHVIAWGPGSSIRCADGIAIPELEIGNLIDANAVPWLSNTLPGKQELPCKPFLRKFDREFISAWLRENGRNRTRAKAASMKKRMNELPGDWGQVLWEETARCLGGKVNGETFCEVAKRLPYRVARQYFGEPLKLEALVFGMFGFLQGKSLNHHDFRHLKVEWEFLAAKHQLSPAWLRLRKHRMRPSGHPEIRIRQLCRMQSAFPSPGELLSPGSIKDFLQKESEIGMETKMSIVINVLLPIGWLFEKFHGKISEPPNAFELLEILPPEKNKWIRSYSVQGIVAKTALESQGVLHLRKAFCEPGNCLTCALGKKILQNSFV